MLLKKITERKLRYKYILQASEINFRIGGCTVYHKCEAPNEKDFVAFMEQILQYKTKPFTLKYNEWDYIELETLPKEKTRFNK